MTSEQFWLQLCHSNFYSTQNLSWNPIRISSLFSAIKSKNSISLPLTHNTNAQPFYLFLHHLHILHFQRQTLGLFICWICSCRHFSILQFCCKEIPPNIYSNEVLFMYSQNSSLLVLQKNNSKRTFGHFQFKNQPKI